MFWQDLRYGLRMLTRRPGFTLIAVLTLALGIGANTAIFSVINSVIIRPLPFPDSERLVAVGTTRTDNRSRIMVATYPDVADWRAQQTAFEHMATYYTRGFTLMSDGGAARLQGAVVSSHLFPLLGISPQMGRTFNGAEDQAGGGRAAVISHALWQNRFSSDRQIIGRTLSLNGESFSIVGVMPAGFQFPIQSDAVDVWANMSMDCEKPLEEPLSAQRGNHFLNVIGRLKPDATIDQAETQLVTIAAQLERQYPDFKTGFSAGVRSFQKELTGDVSASLLVLFGAVGCVLLIACANVANLLLARATGRRREMAMRVAMGAGRWRVMRQLLTESLLLALLGGATGTMLALFGTDALISLSPVSIPRLAESTLDAWVLGFTLLTALMTGLIVGLIPAWQAGRLDLQTVMKDGGHGTSAGRSRVSARSVLIISEVALATLLLVGAGLLLQSFAQLLRVNPGFNPEHLLTLRLGLPDGLYTEPQQIALLHDRLQASLSTLPGVNACSTVSPTPMSGSNRVVGFSVAGRPNPTGRPYPYSTRLLLVGSDYFHTLGVALREGRTFSERDNLRSQPVVLVNEAFVRRYFPDDNPIGRSIDPSISAGEGDPPMREIVGVVADSRSLRLSEAPAPEVYLHIPQVPALGSMTLMLRTQVEAQSLAAAVRQQVMQIDRNLPIYDIKPFDEYLSDSVAQPRFNSLMLGIFAAVALLLTAVGLYGVIACSVTQRTQEIGIRMALGAQPRNVLRMVVWQGMRLVGIGIALGLVGAYLLTRLLKTLLYEVNATDPLTYGAIALLLVVVALAACWIPARQATKVDPLVALRYE